jgi:hypothetical protein
MDAKSRMPRALAERTWPLARQHTCHKHLAISSGSSALRRMPVAASPAVANRSSKICIVHSTGGPLKPLRICCTRKTSEYSPPAHRGEDNTYLEVICWQKPLWQQRRIEGRHVPRLAHLQHQNRQLVPGHQSGETLPHNAPCDTKPCSKMQAKVPVKSSCCRSIRSGEAGQPRPGAPPVQAVSRPLPCVDIHLQLQQALGRIIVPPAANRRVTADTLHTPIEAAQAVCLRPVQAHGWRWSARVRAKAHRRCRCGVPANQAAPVVHHQRHLIVTQRFHDGHHIRHHFLHGVCSLVLQCGHMAPWLTNTHN